MGGRNFVRVRDVVVAPISGRLGREIVTLTVGARAKEGKGGGGEEKKKYGVFSSLSPPPPRSL